MGRIKIEIDREILEKMYLQEGKSSKNIADILNCSWSTIINRLKELGIPLKTKARSQMRYSRKDFDGNKINKAYMLGFRLGDLNVYQPKGKSETIVVRCHTTQREQVEVMESLFKEFGRVTVSENNGHLHVNCFLNNSFQFLLVKEDSAWTWLREDPEQYWPFIAGYTDAEGNFILNQGKARFKIDSYDVSILQWITTWLERHGILVKMKQLNSEGDVQYIQRIQAKYNGDLWRLNINESSSVEKFIECMGPYMRHKIRIRDAKKCLLNIKERRNNGTIK